MRYRLLDVYQTPLHTGAEVYKGNQMHGQESNTDHVRPALKSEVMASG